MHNKLMILGSASNVGKTLITGGIGRILTKDGYNVSPFKSQNIALNAYVDNNGNEMGYAQYLQADMMNITVQVYMQPILLKYIKDKLPQVIIEGKIADNNLLNNSEYLKQIILNNYSQIANNYDIGLIEGSGSCAELNLQSKELSNIALAKLLNSNAILVVDIEKGGVFAQIYGTIMLLPEEDRKLIKGIIINKFHGDKIHLQSGLDILHKRLLSYKLNIPILGIIPYINIKLPEEDIMAISTHKYTKQDINIAIILLPHIANFTDFKVFEYYSNVNIYYTNKAEDLHNADMIIIPGSKETIQDLQFLKENGFFEKIKQLSSNGTIIFGICAGLQMLGHNIKNKNNIHTGLNLLDINTMFNNQKTTKQIKATIQNFSNELSNLNKYEVNGYEIHQGISEGNEKCFLQSDKPIGYYKENVYATYFHDIFNNAIFTASFLNMIRQKKGLEIIKEYDNTNYHTLKINEYDKWENHLKNHINMNAIYQLLNKNIN